MTEYVPDLDDILDIGCGIKRTATDAIPFPVAQIGSHVFDDGEIRILKLMIAERRDQVIESFKEVALDEELEQMLMQDKMDECMD